MTPITISVKGITLKAALNDTPAAHAIMKALPIKGVANRWGDEIYPEIPVVMPQKLDARADVEMGELDYWRR